MPAYGFVIDQRRCIGCHACTVACKSENEVPVGSFRTWVKYTERGAFPEVRRHFTVLRCNHCDDAPCVEICPVVALHKRPDAIVDLDRDQCIGCRACMQACPYDAIYLNEDSGVAEKCHYCAHRTEIGLEPACVIVCPEEAIVSGDADREDSRIATLIREQPTSRRKLDKGTQPRVWYVDALEESLVPNAAREPDSWLWSDRRHPPKAVPGFEAPPDLVTTLNVDHPPVWGWHIWSYLLTKNLSAGAMMIAPFLTWLGVASGMWPEVASLVFLAVTGFLLVHDLGRPERFLKILLHPNPRSWLVKGTWVLLGFGALTSASLAARLADADAESALLRWVNLPFAALASGYTAFLFAQCRGRDLWLERGLFSHLLLRAAFLGFCLAVLIPTAPLRGTDWAGHGFVVLALVNAVWIFVEGRSSPSSESSRRAHALLFGSGMPRWAILALVVAAGSVWAGLASAGDAAFIGGVDIFHRMVGAGLAVLGLFLYERQWIKAAQEVPIS